jgi:thioredoxin reductase
VSARVVDGSVERRRALSQVVASDLPQQIGCEQTEKRLIRVGDDHQTSVPGVYAAGDAVTPVQQIVVAAALGAQAAIAMNRDLVRADVGASDTMSTVRGSASY